MDLTGIKLQPLGYDNNGFVYWKFPYCPDLFVNMVPEYDEDQQLFQQLMETERRRSGSSAVVSVVKAEKRVKVNESNWKRLQRGSGAIRSLIDALGESTNEKALQSNLMNAFMLEVTSSPPTATGTTTSANLPFRGDAAAIIPTQQNTMDDTNASDSFMKTENGGSTVVPLNYSGESGFALKKSQSSSSSASDNVPCTLTLLPQKGFDIPRKFFIDRERAFDDTHLQLGGDDLDDARGDNDNSFKSEEYFSFTKGRK